MEGRKGISRILLRKRTPHDAQRVWTCCVALAGSYGMPPSAAVASFHLMQIEQVIGGVDGDTSVQAIQLRLRFFGENQVQFARIRAWDAAGENPITLIDFDSSVPNASLGDRVLVASPDFVSHVDPPIAVDFTMTNLIPDSYLAAGCITFEGDAGTVYWLLSFGGNNYTGLTTATMLNDDDGDFGPPFDGPLPSKTGQGLLFQGSALDKSITNQDDYLLTSGQAVFTNNKGDSATILGCPGQINLDAGTNLAAFSLFQVCFTGSAAPIDPCCESADINDDLVIDLPDYGLFFEAFVGP